MITQVFLSREIQTQSDPIECRFTIEQPVADTGSAQAWRLHLHTTMDAKESVRVLDRLIKDLKRHRDSVAEDIG